MTKGLKTKIGFNSIQIKNGNIVRLRKDGTIQSILDTYPPSNRKK